MRRFLFGLLLLVLGLLIFTPKTFAAFSFNISSISTTTISSGDQEIDVSLAITDLPSESYFRVALQKASGGSYFGYVKNNNGDWSKVQSLSGDCLGYYKVSDTSTTSLALKFKVGDSLVDQTSYKLKAHRFTNGCSYTEATNSYDFTLNFPTPTPSPAPTPTPTLTPTPTPNPTVKSTPTPSPTIKPTIKPTATPFSSPIKISLKTSSPKASVAGEYDISAPQGKTSPKPSPTVLQSKTEDSGLIFKLLLLAGGILLLASVLFFLPQILERLFNKNKL